MCGGYLTMDVFHTGLTPLVPPKLGSITPSASPVKVGLGFHPGLSPLVPAKLGAIGPAARPERV